MLALSDKIAVREPWYGFLASSLSFIFSARKAFSIFQLWQYELIMMTTPSRFSTQKYHSYCYCSLKIRDYFLFNVPILHFVLRIRNTRNLKALTWIETPMTPDEVGLSHRKIASVRHVGCFRNINNDLHSALHQSQQ